MVINKIDRPDARVGEVLNEVYDLFIDLDATEEQLEFPVLYCNARAGLCRRELDGTDETLEPLFEEIVRSVPAAACSTRRSPLQLLLITLDYDDYVGRLAIGRVFNGQIRKGQEVALCRLDGTVRARSRSACSTATTGSSGWRSPRPGPGDIVAVAGIEEVNIGETISDREDAVAAAADPDRRADDLDGLLDQRLAVLRPRGQARHLAQAQGAARARSR